MANSKEAKIVVEGTRIEVPFKELSEDFQKKVYLDYSDQFEEKAAMSEYYQIRKLVAEKTTSCKVLKGLVLREFEKNKMGDEMVVFSAFSNPSFELDDEISKSFLNWRSARLAKEKLSFSATDTWKMLMIIAKDKSTSSDTLKKMVLERYYNTIELLECIINNPNFKVDDEIRNYIAETGAYAVKKAFVEKEKKDIDALYNLEE